MYKPRVPATAFRLIAFRLTAAFSKLDLFVELFVVARSRIISRGGPNFPNFRPNTGLSPDSSIARGTSRGLVKAVSREREHNPDDIVSHTISLFEAGGGGMKLESWFLSFTN